MKPLPDRFRFFAKFIMLLAPGLLSDYAVGQNAPLPDDTIQAKFPPPWVRDFNGSIDASKIQGNAWDKGIEKFIAEGTAESRKEAAKLAFESSKLGTLSKQLEIKTYFLVGEYEWALFELEKLKNRTVDDWATMGAIYSHLGEYQKSIETLSRAIELANSAVPLWRPLILAQLHEKQGDVFSLIKDTEKSRAAYQTARSYYTQIEPSKPSLRIAKPRGLTSIKTKLEMLDTHLLQASRYVEGTYQDHSYGYSGDIVCWLEAADGKIKDISLQHKEKSDLNASKKIPEAIIKTQSPTVDVITGATVTSNAIKNCVFNTLKHAAGID